MNERDDQRVEIEMTDIRAAASLDDLAAILRRLRRREARRRGGTPLSYRDLAAKTGWAHGVIGDYFSGQTLAPTDRFDVLISLLGASPNELGLLATARDQVEESRRSARHSANNSPPARPRQLPLPPSSFVGRREQQARMDALFGSDTPTTGVMALCGTAGVGKTALGLHWAHRWIERFPGGSLYTDLRGFGPGEPATTVEVLSSFLRSLGVPGTKIGADANDLAADFRTVVADRRMIIYLDNARSAQQVRPLLPGTGSTVTVVTSRDHLAGLVARDGALRVEVDLLTDSEAIDLMRQLVGERVDDDPEAALALTLRCARLPLAIRVAAELVARRGHVGLADLVKELDDEAQRLDLLEAGGDSETAIRQILSWSYQRVSGPAARCFRALGQFPGNDPDSSAIAALVDRPVEETRPYLAELTRAHLLETRGEDRYGTHDLLRTYAVERLAHQADEPHHAALDRLEHHYLRGCQAATESVYPAETEGAPTDSALNAEAALSWLDAELANLLALSSQGVGHGRHHFAVRLSASLSHYLDRSARYLEAVAIHGNAITAAYASGDAHGEAAALGELGQILTRQGRYHDALDHLHRALEVTRSIGDGSREATTLNSLSIAYSRLGDTDQALEYLRLALERYRALGKRVGEGKVLSNLGIEYAQMGRLADAVDHFRQALVIAQEIGDQYGEANALTNLGLVGCWLGRYAEAVDYCERGITLARQVGDRAGEGRLLANLAVNHLRRGDLTQAERLLTEAMRIHQDVGDRAAEAEAYTYLGDLHHARGAFAPALAHHERSLALAIEIRYQYAQAPAHNGAGWALAALGRPAEAGPRFEAALTVARKIGDRLQEAHALAGLADHRRALGDLNGASELFRQAADRYTELGTPQDHRVHDELLKLGSGTTEPSRCATH